MRILASGLVLAALSCVSGVWAQPGSAEAALHARAKWPTYTEASGPFSFSCPNSWTYEGEGLMRLCHLTAPQGAVADCSVTIAIATYPGDRSLLEKQVANSAPDPVDAKKVGREVPTLKWEGWRTALSGKVYERALDCVLSVDGSHYTRIYRYMQVKDNLICLVVSVPEPYSPEQLRLLQVVMDSFRARPSLYDQLEL